MDKIIVTLNGIQYEVHPALKHYKLITKPSSNVVAFGDDGTNVFIQFKSGKAYRYKDVIPDHIAEMYKTDSIGQLVSVLSKNYEYAAIGEKMVKPV